MHLRKESDNEKKANDPSSTEKTPATGTETAGKTGAAHEGKRRKKLRLVMFLTHKELKRRQVSSIVGQNER